ncbi:MAG: twin-arginine translocase subunit TatC [Rhodanobacteraceae bacterium]|nr:MAG: twin-arginine translocase subunit TatC [Rhodanobacteraceae bacterium]
MPTTEHVPPAAPGAALAAGLHGGWFVQLAELRSRAVKAVASVVIAFVCLVPFARHLYGWLAEPLVRRLPRGAHLIATEVTSPFLTPLKFALYIAFFLSAPVIVYQVWAFVSPGLYRHEKRLARPLLFASLTLFYAGCAFAYFLVLPATFRFLTLMVPAGVEMMTDIAHYLDFVMMVFFAFGLCFEIPVIEVVLAATGLANLQTLRSWRRYAIVAAAAIAAMITPPDMTSMLLLLVPMVLLYELGLLAVRVMVKPAPVQPAAPG